MAEIDQQHPVSIEWTELCPTITDTFVCSETLGEYVRISTEQTGYCDVPVMVTFVHKDQDGDTGPTT